MADTVVITTQDLEPAVRLRDAFRDAGFGTELLTPVAVKGWYHAVFHNARGEERLLSIDQVLEHMDGWRM